MLDFKNKLVLVTGSARGIGRGVAFEYAKEGARVIFLDILGDRLKETLEDFKKAGYTGWGFQCDLTSDEGVASLGAKIIKEIGVPDIIHNNAFWAPSSSLENIDVPSIAKALDVSVLGYLRVVKAFVNEMIARKSGWIVNTASPNGITPAASYAAYGMPYNLCKAADISISQAMAAGLKQHGIGVSVLFPDAVRTEFLREQTGTAPKEFTESALKFFETNGMSPEEAAPAFIEGIRQEKFMVATYPNFDKILLEYAKNGLDPNAVNVQLFDL